MSGMNPWTVKPSGTVNGTFASPTFTGTGGSGYIIPLAQSYVAVVTPADTSEDTLATITVPANAIGVNGIIRVRTYWTFTNNGNAKTMKVRFSGASGTVVGTAVLSTQVSAELGAIIANVNSASSQKGHGFAVTGNNAIVSTAMTTASVDTTAATTIVITGQKATAGDALTLEGYMVEIVKP